MKIPNIEKIELYDLKGMLDASDEIEIAVKYLRNRTALKEFEDFYLFIDKVAQQLEIEIEKRESNAKPTRK
jgi:hypothetical protein